MDIVDKLKLMAKFIGRVTEKNLARDISENAIEAIETIESLRNQLSTNTWQPIETAPKDGTIVDLWDNQQFRWVNMRYDYHYWQNGIPQGEKSWGGESTYGPGANPSHWMPLPTAPTHKER